MLTEKELRTAAKEMNQVLGLDPIIDPKQGTKDLATEIKEVAETKKPEPLIKPGDKFTPATQRVIDILIGKIEDNGNDAEPEEDAPRAVAEKIHKKNIGDRKVNTIKGQDVPDEDAPEPETPNEADPVVAESKPKKAPKAPKKEGVRTKKAVIEAMIATKKGATIEEMAQAMVDEDVDADYAKNLVVTKLWLSKMGFDTKKAAIEKNPYFKKK